MTVHIQLARDEAHFDSILGWFIGQQKLHEFVRDDLTFISAFAGVNRDEMPFRYPDNIKGRSSESHQARLNGRVVTELDAVKCIVYALSDSARWWHEYGKEVLKC